MAERVEERLRKHHSKSYIKKNHFEQVDLSLKCEVYYRLF